VALQPHIALCVKFFSYGGSVGMPGIRQEPILDVRRKARLELLPFVHGRRFYP